jgi:hypothetical protein
LIKQIESILERLNQRDCLQSLSPTADWDPTLKAQIEALDWKGRHSETRIIALITGLHLRNDSLDTSHSYAQQIEYDATGAYWHGIMHRMEGGYPNSKNWFDKVGQHPAMSSIKKRVAALLQAEGNLEKVPAGRARDILQTFMENEAWNTSQFVDLIAWQESQVSSEATRPILEQIQQIEITELFDYTLTAAFSS